jgi:hypothetical protein
VLRMMLGREPARFEAYVRRLAAAGPGPAGRAA